MARDYSDTLRAIGRFLDEADASSTKIVDAGDRLTVSWQEKGGAQRERGYRSFELEELRTKARLLRAAGDSIPPSSTSEIFRLLGWILDQMGAELVSITDTPEGLRLSATTGGRRATRTYAREELIQLVDARRHERGLPHSPLKARLIGPVLEDSAP